MDETRNDAPQTGEAPQTAKPQPLRRVGSFTLGVCLIAAGIFFLLAYFVPGVDWKLMLKIAPAAGLILLGGEVLFFAARPGRWKYDFWSVLICLVLMGGCFCLSLLPVVWDELGPERNQASMKLGQEYTTEAYDKIKQTAPDIRVKNISGNAYLYSSEAKTLRDVNAGNGYLSLTVELFGGYDSVQAFAQDCRSVTDAVQQCSAQPDELRITWSPENDPARVLPPAACRMWSSTRWSWWALRSWTGRLTRWQSRPRCSTCWTKKTKNRRSPKLFPRKVRS